MQLIEIKKKILTVLVKIAIGIVSFWIIYNRLNEIPQLKEQCLFWFTEPRMYFNLMLVFGLMTINWGIESYKWKSITTQIEPISFSKAIKSVFSGICVGNIAPGRSHGIFSENYFF